MEVVGLVASAIQILDATVKLKELWSKIHHAPKDVLDLVQEVSLSGDLIADIQHQYQLEDPANTDMDLVTDLDTTIKLHKRTGALRVFCRGPEIQSCKERLQRVQMMMLNAQQAYNVALVKANQALIIQEIRNLPSHQITSIEPYLLNPAEASTDPKDVFEGSHLLSTTTTIRRGCKSATEYRLGLPAWLSRRSVQILLDRSHSNWGLTVRVYNRLGPDASVFSAVARGDWSLVQQMFATGQASPYDVDPLDRTLLNMAARQTDPDACQMLMNHGLDLARESGQLCLSPVAEMLLYGCGQRFSSDWERNVQTFRLFAQVAPECFLDENTVNYSLLLRQPPLILYTVMPSISPLIKLFSPDQLVSTALECCDMDTLEYLMGSTLNLHPEFAIAKNTSTWRHAHIGLLCNAARAFGRPDMAVPRREWCLRVLEEIVKFEAQNTLLHEYTSPLDYFLPEYLQYRPPKMINREGFSWNDYFTEAVQVWLSILVEAKADLEQHGLAEQLLMDYLRSESVSRFRQFEVMTTRSQRLVFYIQGIVYGHEIDDWEIFVAPAAEKTYKSVNMPLLSSVKHIIGEVEYEMAAEFWNWVENLELFNILGVFIAADDGTGGLEVTWDYPNVLVAVPVL